MHALPLSTSCNCWQNAIWSSPAFRQATGVHIRRRCLPSAFTPTTGWYGYGEVDLLHNISITWWFPSSNPFSLTYNSFPEPSPQSPLALVKMKVTFAATSALLLSGFATAASFTERRRQAMERRLSNRRSADQSRTGQPLAVNYTTLDDRIKIEKSKNAQYSSNWAVSHHVGRCYC